MNNSLKIRIEAIQEIAIAHYKCGSKMPSDSKGTEREFFVRDILEKIFPNSFRFSSGEIVDSADNKSGQVDLALEFPHEPSFPSPASNERLMLAESVIVALEVKSGFKQWDELTTKTQQINALNRKIELEIERGEDPKSKFPTRSLINANKIPVIGIFYSGVKKIETVKNKFDKTPIEHRPAAILILDKGYFIYDEVQLSGAEGIYGFITLLAKLSNSVAQAKSSVEKYLNI